MGCSKTSGSDEYCIFLYECSCESYLFATEPIVMSRFSSRLQEYREAFANCRWPDTASPADFHPVDVLSSMNVGSRLGCWPFSFQLVHIPDVISSLLSEYAYFSGLKRSSSLNDAIEWYHEGVKHAFTKEPDGVFSRTSQRVLQHNGPFI